MNNLSQECIDTINGFVYFPTTEPTATEILRDGMKKALTEPLLYQSAGLMSVEEALRFVEWKSSSSYVYSKTKKAWYIAHDWEPKFVTTTELLTIFRNQNQK